MNSRCAILPAASGHQRPRCESSQANKARSCVACRRAPPSVGYLPRNCTAPPGEMPSAFHIRPSYAKSPHSLRSRSVRWVDPALRRVLRIYIRGPYVWRLCGSAKPMRARCAWFHPGARRCHHTGCCQSGQRSALLRRLRPRCAGSQVARNPNPNGETERPCLACVRGPECVSGEICNVRGETVFVNAAQRLDWTRENTCRYGGTVSEPTIYGYVAGNPVSFVDPNGLQIVIPIPVPPPGAITPSPGVRFPDLMKPVPGWPTWTSQILFGIGLIRRKRQVLLLQVLHALRSAPRFWSAQKKLVG
jgi:hypothetical protein